MKELQAIFRMANAYFNNEQTCVLATIVKIEGSGYRRKGTRMLISEDGKFTGAISGGCVEKEVWLHSESVFEDRKPKLITYDGRYRLGCEGTLFILIEPISIDDEKLGFFNSIYSVRKSLSLSAFFNKGETLTELSGTYIISEDGIIPLGTQTNIDNDNLNNENFEVYNQTLKPARSLYIFGSEHDSVALCKIASHVGIDVTVIAHPLNEKRKSYFPGTNELLHLLPENLNQISFDAQTACLLMSHSFSRDFAYLLALSDYDIPYIGLLGPHKRKNQLLDQLIEHKPEISDKFLDNIYGPVGLDIGAETPQEIAISILAEIQAAFTNTTVDNLRNKSGNIHERQE